MRTLSSIVVSVLVLLAYPKVAVGIVLVVGAILLVALLACAAAHVDND